MAGRHPMFTDSPGNMIRIVVHSDLYHGGLIGGGDMGQRRKSRRTSLAADRGIHSVSTGAVHESTSIWGRRRVLLLNSTYEPLTALPIRRAVVMLLCGKADVVHDDPGGPVIHSATRSIVVPSVIRLRSYVRVPYRARIPMTRAALMHRDRFRCAYCGSKADTVDHVVPRSRGGSHTWENCVASCSPCNHRKADRLLSELGWTLQASPTKPKGQHWRLLSTVKELDPAWARYLGEGAA
jgi:5-methylcytosine-specific restriction endonuclease McrA